MSAIIPSPLNLADEGVPKAAAEVPGIMLIGVFVKVGKPKTFPGMLLATLLLFELMLDELDDFTELELLLPPLELILDALLRELLLTLLNELEVADEVVEELTDDVEELVTLLELVPWDKLDWLLLTELDREVEMALDVALPVALLFAAIPEPLHAANKTLAVMTSHKQGRRSSRVKTIRHALDWTTSRSAAACICLIASM